jgi:hypothetical protein
MHMYVFVAPCDRADVTAERMFIAVAEIGAVPPLESMYLSFCQCPLP